MKWQALEGLGAISFNQGDVPAAERYFTEALQFTGENTAANMRIVGKLKHVLRKGDELSFQPPYNLGSTPRQTPVAQVIKKLYVF